MLVARIIQFKLRGSGRTCALITGYFHGKAKSLKQIFEWIIIDCKNIA